VSREKSPRRQTLAELRDMARILRGLIQTWSWTKAQDVYMARVNPSMVGDPADQSREWAWLWHRANELEQAARKLKERARERYVATGGGL